MAHYLFLSVGLIWWTWCKHFSVKPSLIALCFSGMSPITFPIKRGTTGDQLLAGMRDVRGGKLWKMVFSCAAQPAWSPASDFHANRVYFAEASTRHIWFYESFVSQMLMLCCCCCFLADVKFVFNLLKGGSHSNGLDSICFSWFSDLSLVVFVRDMLTQRNMFTSADLMTQRSNTGSCCPSRSSGYQLWGVRFSHCVQRKKKHLVIWDA